MPLTVSTVSPLNPSSLEGVKLLAECIAGGAVLALHRQKTGVSASVSGCSFIVLGAAGSGKTTMIESIYKEVSV